MAKSMWKVALVAAVLGVTLAGGSFGGRHATALGPNPNPFGVERNRLDVLALGPQLDPYGAPTPAGACLAMADQLLS